MKRLIAFSCACWLSLTAWAVVASPVPFEYTKPDGTVVLARVYGDEFHSYVESLDGELLSGSREPAVLQEAALRRSQRRAPMGPGSLTFPTTGSPRSLVLLVSFADLDMGESLEDFRDLLNRSGYDYNGATGSCRDYYIASSDSLFLPQFDCFGPFKLSRNMEYYGGNTGQSSSAHGGEMIAEACELAHEAGVNFKNYDLNNDGILDNVFVFYAGHNEAEGGGENTVWPHQSNISYMKVRLDGVTVSTYACTSEYKGSRGSTRCGIGTFCHEFGHVIGQPDFYDTGYNYYSVGNWDIMCNGSYNNNGNTPPPFSAYERMYEGWLHPKQLLLPGQYTLTDIPFRKEAYLIAAETHNLSGTSPNPSEFFLLDYRSGTSVWDSYLPNSGLIVWHIDYSASAWLSNTPNNGPTVMRMHLEEANGITWKRRNNGENGRASDVYPGSNNVTAFTPVLHNGTQLSQPVFNIREAGEVLSFTFISDGGSTLRTDKESIELVTPVGDNKKIAAWNPQSFDILGTGLDPEKPLTLTSGSNMFRLYVGDEAPDWESYDWSRSLELYANSDSTLEQRVWISFTPVRQDCDVTKGNISIASTGASISLPVTGTSPRPVLVHTPVTLPVTDVTPYSFKANWLNQDDAEQFYLTLYQVEEGTTEYKQGFESFTDFSKIREQGWQSNTCLTTTTDKADGQRALYFKNYGDQITSETYPAPVTRLSFWYNAFASTMDTVGVIELEAFNGTEWEQGTQIVVTKKSKKVTESLDFEPEKNYRAFRLTWLDNGEKGVALDAFVATISQQITYVHKGKEIKLTSFVFGDTASYTFGDLEPANRYFYQVQTTDLDKGCEEHLTDLSDPVEVTTIAGQPRDSKQLTLALDSINYDPAQHAIYLTAPQSGDMLYCFDAAGRLVYTQQVRYGEYIYPLDPKRFIPGEVYMLQHAVSGKLGRKNKWIKFIF